MSSTKGHIHFIAIGGSAMHNLAIALQEAGYLVTGSDDDIFEPSFSRLKARDLLPDTMGWFPEKIREDTEAVILGMHAREDNPELIAAGKLNIPIYSFPDYIYQATQHALRVVIAGSHGKSTITSMVAHVLNKQGKSFDYLVGAGVQGFDNMVRLSGAPVIILEGDEYWSSILDKTPKFLRYRHHIGLISGIAWDHINAFPTREIYVDQFRKFLQQTPESGKIIFNAEDKEVVSLVDELQHAVSIPYRTPEYKIDDGVCRLHYGDHELSMKVFGRHNMQNLAGAIEVLKALEIGERDILESLSTFEGASNRLEKLTDSNDLKVFRDFAHSPSKLKATNLAVREMFPDRKLINCFELHTYSSLNRNFLENYRDTLREGDRNIVFINDHTLKIKKMEFLEDEVIKTGFNNADLVILRDREALEKDLTEHASPGMVLLLMSSGNFGGLNDQALLTSLHNRIQKIK